MRVAFIVGRFPALSETFVINQITGLLERGHEIDIYAEQPEDHIVHDEVSTYHLTQRTHYLPRIPRSWVLRALKAFMLILVKGWRDPERIMRALDIQRYGREASSLRLIYAVIPFLGTSRTYDVLHCHFGPFGVRGMFLREVGALRGMLVTTFHGADLTQGISAYGEGYYRRLFATGELFLPISETWKQRLMDLGCPPEKIHVHHMGINCMEFGVHLRRIDGSKAVRLLSVCRLTEKKGIEYAIRAVAAVVETGCRVQYDIVGDGPLRSHLDELIQQLQMTDTIITHGWKKKPEVVAMLERAHVLLAPSITAEDGDQEGIPVSLMEAMAAGLPVISTHHSGIPELIQDDVSGYLVPERDFNAVATKICELMDQPDTWVRMGHAGRDTVERHFNIDTLNDRLVAIFATALGIDDARSTAYASSMSSTDLHQ